MQIMDFSSANCKNCYRCVQNCHVKAIKIINDQATITKDRCLACGQCFVVCPQNARNIISDMNLVKSKMGTKKVVATIAPSYKGFFDDPSKFLQSLKRLGFDAVHETAVGANMVTELYKQYTMKNPKANMITSCCPAITTMIEVYYPELLDYLIPIESPMIVHSKILKEHYGDDVFITFIGPCIAKKKEAHYYKQTGTIDAVLTFEEIEHWIQEQEVTIEEDMACLPLEKDSIGQFYPIESGILKGLTDVIHQYNYEPLSISGLEACKELFNAMIKDDLKGLFIEANACEGGCIGGPAVPKKNEDSIYTRLFKLKKHLNEKTFETHENTPTLNMDCYSRPFQDKHISKKRISEECITDILHSMGKHIKSDELNCGACGYNTCRDKAIAVFEGMSHPDMCIHYLRQKAERVTNTIFEHSPNIIFLLDENLNFIEANPVCQDIFMLHGNSIQGKHVSFLLNEDDFKQVQKTKQNIIGKKVAYSKYGLIVIENILYLKEQNSYLVILLNLTEQEKRNEQLAILKQNTLSAAQNVIDKQMRVAQEIAGLLGETTAETKITLMKLQQIVIGEEGEMK